MDDPLDINTFTLVDSFQLSAASYGDVPFRVNFNTYSGHGSYIAFRCLAASDAYVYVDDVTLQRIPLCESVDYLAADDITATSAVLTWQETADVNDFIVEYQLAGDTSWTAVSVTGLADTLTGLQPGSDYTVRVRPDCTGDVAAATITFRTLCETITTFPYNESFEDGAFGCWRAGEVTGSGGGWRNHQYTSLYQMPQDGDHYAYFQPSSFGNTAEGMLISPVFNLSGLSQPGLAFFYDALCNFTSTDSLAVLIRTSATDSWHLLAGYSCNDTTDILWQSDTLTLPQPGASYQIAFRGVSGGGGGIFLDNVTVMELDTLPPVCESPTDLHQVPALTESPTITVAWTDPNGTTHWRLQYRLPNSSWTMVTVNGTPEYTITGLTDSMTYEIQVQAICDDGLMSVWSESLFATAYANHDGIAGHAGPSVTLYPNPARDVVHVQCAMNDASFDGASVELSDAYGKRLEYVTMEGAAAQIGLSRYANGIYFVKVIANGNVVAVRKVLKQ